MTATTSVAHSRLREQFLRVRHRDLARWPARLFLTTWQVTPELHHWHGPEDIAAWIAHIEKQTDELAHTRWTLPVGPVESQLIEMSAAFNDVTLRNLFGDHSVRHENLDFYNMTDWIMQHAYPRPADERIERVLDFGAGFGRQAALWLTAGSGPRTYVAMDAIELPYISQAAYLDAAPCALKEYLASPDDFKVSFTRDRGALHLPSWRFDLLPDGFFDMVLCVQVLPEIREDVLFHTLSLFHRTLRPGGYLYIRDHSLKWHPGHKQHLERLLPSFGFDLEFAPRWRDRHDIHGLPQIWRRRETNPRSRVTRFKDSVKAVNSTARRLWYWRFRKLGSRRRAV
jgi:SAM-dependent methyltransferase